MRVENVYYLNSGQCEALCLQLPDIGTSVAVVYRPPKAHETNFKTMMEDIHRFFDDCPDMGDRLLLGDFNFPGVQWIEGQAHTKDQHHGVAPLSQVTEDLFLTQFVTSPTRGDNILDLVFTSDKEMVSSVQVTDTKVSNHKLVEITMGLPAMTNTNTHDSVQSKPFLGQLNFYGADWARVQEELSKRDLREAILSAPNIDEQILDLVGQACQSADIAAKRQPRKQTIPRDRRCLFRRRCSLKKDCLNH